VVERNPDRKLSFQKQPLFFHTVKARSQEWLRSGRDGTEGRFGPWQGKGIGGGDRSSRRAGRDVARVEEMLHPTLKR
jgi:hypothetical protein